MIDLRNDLARTTLAVLCILAMVAGSLWLLRPFIEAIAWAAMIVVATWPLLLKLQSRLGGRRGLGAAVMSIAMVVLVFAPIGLAVGVIGSHASSVDELVASAVASGLPLAPGWLEGLPWVGPRLAARWNEFVALDPAERVQRIQPYAAPVAQWIVGKLGSVGATLVQVLLTAIVAAILYVNGETAARGALALGARLAGPRGEKAVRLGGQAVRAVALGVFVTAVLQSALAGVGVALAGVPLPGLLTAVMFVLGLLQVGPMPILVPAVIWLYSTGQTGWATALLVWTLVVGPMDNWLRPILIRRGADLPLLLIFAGVIGGLIALGLIGIFVGPVFLAVVYTLYTDWMTGPRSSADAGDPGAR